MISLSLKKVLVVALAFTLVFSSAMPAMAGTKITIESSTRVTQTPEPSSQPNATPAPTPTPTSRAHSARQQVVLPVSTAKPDYTTVSEWQYSHGNPLSVVAQKDKLIFSNLPIPDKTLNSYFIGFYSPGTVTDLFVRDTGDKYQCELNVSISATIGGKKIEYTDVYSLSKPLTTLEVDLTHLPKNKTTDETSAYTFTFTTFLWNSQKSEMSNRHRYKDAPLLMYTTEQTGFYLPANYASNLKIYSSKRTDEAALEFYRRPLSDKYVALAAEITAGITDDYQKARAIYDWVCDNMYYDNDYYYGNGPKSDSSETMRGVCADYTNLTHFLLTGAGIPAKTIIGSMRKLGSHAWNEAFVDNHWITIDTTIGSTNKYENGEYMPGAINTPSDRAAYRSTDARERYLDDGYGGCFDVRLENFSRSHTYTDYSEDHLPPDTSKK
jgi:hypothetical protein